MEDAAIIARHLLSQEMELETAHQMTADAEAEGARRLGLYGVDRDVVPHNHHAARSPASTAAPRIILTIGNAPHGRKRPTPALIVIW